jgi:thioredoxin 1
MAKFLQKQEDYKGIVEGNKVVIADFFATWCGPCKMLMPVIDDLSKDLGDKVEIIKIDVDKFPELAEQNNVMGVPSVFFFKDGKLQELSKGFKTKADLQKIVDQYIS